MKRTLEQKTLDYCAAYSAGPAKLSKIAKIDTDRLMRQMAMAQAELNAMTMAIRQSVEARGGTVEQVQDELIITEGNPDG